METRIPLIKGVTEVVGQLKTDPRASAALRRVIESLNDPDGVISAFDSFASGPAPARPELG